MALVHGDIDEDDHWLRMLDYRSDTVVTVAALESGHSADISGEVTVLCRRQRQLSGDAGGSHAMAQPRLSSYYFRTTDNTATFVRQQDGL